MKPKNRPINSGQPLTADFPLTTYPLLIEKIQPPTGPFDPTGAWTMNWTIYTCIHGPQSIGDVTISRSLGPVGGVSLKVRHTKKLMGGMRRLDGVLHLGRHEDSSSVLANLSAPRRWSFRVEVLNGAGQPIPETRLDRRLEVVDGRLRVESRLISLRASADAVGAIAASSTVTELPTDPSAYTTRWALFDAVSRMAVRESTETAQPLRFTLIDHFDQVKPDQQLVVRGKVSARIGGRSMELTALDHTGRGILPFTYWVDPSGRPIIVSTGLEVYVLDTAKSM